MQLSTKGNLLVKIALPALLWSSEAGRILRESKPVLAIFFAAECGVMGVLTAIAFRLARVEFADQKFSVVRWFSPREYPAKEFVGYRFVPSMYGIEYYFRRGGVIEPALAIRPFRGLQTSEGIARDRAKVVAFLDEILATSTRVNQFP